MKILNIIVYYDNCDEVIEYVKEASSISEGNVCFWVIVNKDTENRAKDIANLASSNKDIRISVFDYGDNVGYLNSMLKSIKRQDFSEFKYIILSNTDIKYKQKSFFKTLSSNSYDSSIGCIAPSVYKPSDNSYSNPHYLSRIPKRKLLRLKYIFTFPLLARTYLKLAKIKASKNSPERKASCYVYSPHGCYMIFTREFIMKICGIEYGVKLYSEESFIGELLLKNNMKCYYDNSIEVIHEESAVTGKINYRRRFRMWKESIKFILKEFY